MQVQERICEPLQSDQSSQLEQMVPNLKYSTDQNNRHHLAKIKT